ncbi:hypothetical protein HYW54_04765 [Candidatus Gottesmanbacteria bacterium]|nr:hypothetical protein [Candidatus Gottesmanbacteria bacterium]
MPARRKKPHSVSKHKLIHPKYHHHIHFTTLIAGIIIFGVIIFVLTNILEMKKDLSKTGAKPTCLELDAAISNKNGVNYLNFNAQISVPYPKNANVECRTRYSYDTTKESQFGTLTFSHPSDTVDQACLGEFPLSKPPTNIQTVELEVIPYNVTSQIEGNTCLTEVSLP